MCAGGLALLIRGTRLEHGDPLPAPPPPDVRPLITRLELSGRTLHDTALGALRLHLWPCLAALVVRGCEFARDPSTGGLGSR